MSVLKRILRDLDEGAVGRCARRRRCVAAEAPPQCGYVFDDDAEEEAREQRLRAVASLAAHVDGALLRVREEDIEENGLFTERYVRTAVATHLEQRDAHDATLRAFFAPCASRTHEGQHVPTVALWTMAALGRACPECVLCMWEQDNDDERARLAEESAVYFAALRTALYTNRPGAFYAHRRQLMRRIGARLEELLEDVGGVERLVRVRQHPRLRCR